MRRVSTIICLLALLVGPVAPVRPASLGYTDSAAPRQIRWPNKTIRLSLSTALYNPGANIKLGSDVVGAARRALARWSSMADLKFLVTESTGQSISPGNSGDGISLITIADTPQNNSMFGGGAMTGKTRIFYDEDTGAISEADIVINPHPVSPDGLPVQFSTDGSPGTYDLESTLTHEVGHLLGLEHSSVVASTMHARQGLNGLYNQRAFTERTLSEDDRAKVRSLYEPGSSLAEIEGRILKPATGGIQTPVNGAQVWVEENTTGRLIASTIASASGMYRIENLFPSTYRVLTGQATMSGLPEVLPVFSTSGAREQQRTDRNAEGGSRIDLKRNETRSLNLVISPQHGSSGFLNPRLVGTNGELSTMPVPAEPGKRLKVYLAGEGVDQVPGSGISITSPFFTVHAPTLVVESFRTSFPVVSVDVTVAANAPFGDYTIRLQSNSGDVAYVAGAITIDPGVDSVYANPADDPRFFVKQLYRDVLGRDADSGGLEYWAGQLEQCGQDATCLRTRRINVSAAFFSETEFQRKGSFIYQVYRSGLARRPLFAEFINDREQFVDLGRSEEWKQAFALAFVQRPEFLKKFPATMRASEFIDGLLSGIMQNSAVDLSAERTNLLSVFDGSATGRATILRRVAENTDLMKAEYDKALVLMQFFGYLLRDPDEDGYKLLLNALDSKNQDDPSRYTPMICAFLNSAEYQSRFGMLITHSTRECGR